MTRSVSSIIATIKTVIINKTQVNGLIEQNSHEMSYMKNSNKKNSILRKLYSKIHETQFKI